MRFMNLLKWRTKMGLTQKQAAKKFGTTQPVYCRWEKRERAPRPAVAARIVERTGGEVRLDDLERRGR
jgi:transcriptional regulator with XRE-family HTH domain